MLTLCTTAFNIKQDKQWEYKRNVEARSRNGCCHGKQEVVHILSVSVAFVIQRAKRIRLILLSSVAMHLYFYHMIS